MRERARMVKKWFLGFGGKDKLQKKNGSWATCSRVHMLNSPVRLYPKCLHNNVLGKIFIIYIYIYIERERERERERE
jgi:hypothetical protein